MIDINRQIDDNQIKRKKERERQMIDRQRFPYGK